MGLFNSTGRRKQSVFSRLIKNANLTDKLAEKLEINGGFPSETFRKMAFGFLLIFIYIFFQHNIETLFRDITKAELEIKEKRASYIAHKSALMVKSKHSQVSTSLESRGLRNIQPPVKIIAKD
jgi:hypothetical protein